MQIAHKTRASTPEPEPMPSTTNAAVDPADVIPRDESGPGSLAVDWLRSAGIVVAFLAGAYGDDEPTGDGGG